MKRREILERKKAIAEVIKSASDPRKDHLFLFPSFHHYDKNGLSLHLHSGCGDKLTTHHKRYIQTLLKLNMEKPYGPEWADQEKTKCREMVAQEAKYIFVHMNSDMGSDMIGRKRSDETRGPMVGFVQYRFVVEEEMPVLYLYELQLEDWVHGKGLGKFLMELVEVIALENRMSAVLLTVQKANFTAMKFYLGKMGYAISSISPSRVDPVMGVEKSYEILGKAFNDEAKAVFE